MFLWITVILLHPYFPTTYWLFLICRRKILRSEIKISIWQMFHTDLKYCQFLICKSKTLSIFMCNSPLDKHHFCAKFSRFNILCHLNQYLIILSKNRKIDKYCAKYFKRYKILTNSNKYVQKSFSFLGAMFLWITITWHRNQYLPLKILRTPDVC